MSTLAVDRRTVTPVRVPPIGVPSFFVAFPQPFSTRDNQNGSYQEVEWRDDVDECRHFSLQPEQSRGHEQSCAPHSEQRPDVPPM
jgi:hypothetical protein